MMNPFRQDSEPQVKIAVIGQPHSWNADCQAFRRNHGTWSMLKYSKEPLYSIPEPAINCLARAHGKNPPLLDRAAVRAEQDYTNLCKKHNAVGSWLEQPIVYPLLNPPPPMPNAQTVQLLKWTKAEEMGARRVVEMAQDANLRVKGYAGWLLTEPGFIGEVAQLTETWRGLPEAQRPSFPLGRALPVPTPPRGAKRARRTVATYAVPVRAFLDRWGLMHMASWDLPAPQGPLLPYPLLPGSPALPRHAIHLVLPLHYPLQGDDDLLRRILDFQKQFARDQGLDESLAGLPHYKAYAGMFDWLHLERAMLSRFEAGARPRGLMGRIEEAATSVLNCSLAQIHKHRKAISACRRGQRANVAWLRPRIR